MAEVPQHARKSYCSPSRCSFGAPATRHRPFNGMSADPRQPYTYLFGRTPLLQAGVVPDLWRPRRLAMPFSNSLPQSGYLRPLCTCPNHPIVTLGNPPSRLSLYTHMPSSYVSSYFGIVTLSELRPIFTIHSFSYWSGLLTALAARETLFSVHSFESAASFFLAPHHHS